MSEIKFELDTKGFQVNVLKADWMLAHMESEARKQGSDVKPFIGFDRAKAIVRDNND